MCFYVSNCTDSQYSSQYLTIVSSLKHKNTQPLYIFNRENPQNSEPQTGPRRGLDFIALSEFTMYMTVFYIPILSVIYRANLICLLFGRDSYNKTRVMMIYLHKMVWHSICQNNLNLYQRNLFRWITPMLDTKWGKYTSCFSQILDVLFPLFIPWTGLRKFLNKPIEEHP